jgi:hypothetical protein
MSRHGPNRGRSTPFSSPFAAGTALPPEPFITEDSIARRRAATISAQPSFAYGASGVSAISRREGVGVMWRRTSTPTVTMVERSKTLAQPQCEQQFTGFAFRWRAGASPRRSLSGCQIIGELR